jgi:hypothetical protein
VRGFFVIAFPFYVCIILRMASRPAAVRQSEKMFPTPIIGDVLFSERWVGQSRNLPAYGTAHPDTAKWPNHKFVFARERGEPDAQDVFDVFYVADRANQDTYNFSFTQADLGGTRFNAVERTYVTLRSAFNPGTPAVGAAIPNTPTDLFTGGYILVEKRQQRIGQQELDSLYVAETHVYMRRCSITQLGIDPINGKMLTSTSILRHSSEIVTGSTTAAALFADPANAYWGLQADGTQRSGKQLSCAWYEIVTETVVSGTFSGGAVTLRTYNTTQAYYWPPVLSSISIGVWERRDGGIRRFAEPVYTEEGYNGECKAEVTETFHVTAPTVADPDVMLPLPINISNPFYSISVRPCLFAGATYSFTNGTEDPDYVYTVANYTFPSTSPTTWPDFVTITNVKPFRGGYMKSTIKIYKPS